MDRPHPKTCCARLLKMRKDGCFNVYEDEDGDENSKKKKKKLRLTDKDMNFKIIAE